MTRPGRRLTSLVVATVVLLAVVGCSSDSSDSAGSGSEGSAAAPSGDAAAPAAPDDGGGAESDGDCVTDSNELSGSSTVTWDDGDVAPGLTMTFVDNENALDPPSLTVGVGERFAIAHGPGTDLRAVKIGCAGGQTMPINAIAGFVITSPGTFTIIDEIADDGVGAEVGSVTVE